MRRFISISSALIGLAVLTTAASAATLQPFVHEGAPLPGTAFHLGRLEAPLINDNGLIVMEAALTDADGLTPVMPDGLAPRAIVLGVPPEGERPAATRLVVLDGDPVAVSGAPGARIRIGRLSQLALLPGPIVVIHSQWDAGDGAVQDGLFRWDDGQLSTIAVEDGPVPELLAEDDRARWGNFTSLHISPASRSVFFEATLRRPSPGARVLARQEGPGQAPRLVIRQFDPTAVPGVSLLNRVAVNSLGEATIAFRVPSTEDTFQHNRVTVAGIERLRGGQAAPGAGAPFAFFDQLRPNDAGELLFRARPGTLADPQPGGLWYDDGAGNLLAVLRDGDKAPGVIGGRFASPGVEGWMYLGGGGDWVVKTELQGDGVDGRTDGVLVYGKRPQAGAGVAPYAIAVREGDPAPGLADGVVFEELVFDFSGLGGTTLGIDDAGNLVFRARLSGPGIRTSNRESLWLYDRSEGRLELLIQAGQAATSQGYDYVLDTFEVRLGSGVEDGLVSGLNNHGEVGIVVRYSALDPEAPLLGGVLLGPASAPTDRPAVAGGGGPVPSGPAPADDAPPTASSDPIPGSGGCAGGSPADAGLLAFALASLVWLRRRRTSATVS